MSAFSFANCRARRALSSRSDSRSGVTTPLPVSIAKRVDLVDCFVAALACDSLWRQWCSNLCWTGHVGAAYKIVMSPASLFWQSQPRWRWPRQRRRPRATPAVRRRSLSPLRTTGAATTCRARRQSRRRPQTARAAAMHSPRASASPILEVSLLVCVVTPVSHPMGRCHMLPTLPFKRRSMLDHINVPCFGLSILY